MKHKHTKEIIEAAISSSTSWAQVCRTLNIPPATGSQTYLKKKTLLLGINFSHFTGQAHNKGKKNPRRKTAIEYTTSTTIASHRLKLRLFQDGVKKKECEWCKLSEWRGQDLPLELDHIDNNHFNNQLVNLQILCPNCHSQKTRQASKGTFVS